MSMYKIYQDKFIFSFLIFSFTKEAIRMAFILFSCYVRLFHVKHFFYFPWECPICFLIDPGNKKLPRNGIVAVYILVQDALRREWAFLIWRLWIKSQFTLHIKICHIEHTVVHACLYLWQQVQHHRRSRCSTNKKSISQVFIFALFTAFFTAFSALLFQFHHQRHILHLHLTV